jgi:hypothetical protein
MSSEKQTDRRFYTALEVDAVRLQREPNASKNEIFRWIQMEGPKIPEPDYEFYAQKILELKRLGSF